MTNLWAAPAWVLRWASIFFIFYFKKLIHTGGFSKWVEAAWWALHGPSPRWWGFTSPPMIQQDMPCAPDLLTTAWPTRIHKHAQQTGEHTGTPKPRSYDNNAVENLSPALVVDTPKRPLLSSASRPFFLPFMLLHLSSSCPETNIYEKMKTLFYRCNLTTTICRPPPFYCLILFSFSPPPPTLCPTFGHPIISIHQTIISPAAYGHSGVMSDKRRSSTYPHTHNCFSSHPPQIALLKKKSSLDFSLYGRVGAKRRRQRIYP